MLRKGRKDLKAPTYAALNDEVESRDDDNDDVYSPAKIARPAAMNSTRFYDDDVVATGRNEHNP